jgi:hypothetical protein
MIASSPTVQPVDLVKVREAVHLLLPLVEVHLAQGEQVRMVKQLNRLCLRLERLARERANAELSQLMRRHVLHGSSSGWPAVRLPVVDDAKKALQAARAVNPLFGVWGGAR